MPITATDNPNAFRVMFPISEVAGPGVTLSSEVQIVCLVHVTPDGVNNKPSIQIAYQHHLIRSRVGAVGPFDQETEQRLGLSPALKATIEHGVKEELWSSFNKTITEAYGA